MSEAAPGPRLVSFLGTGNYQPVCYTLDDRTATESRWVVFALAQLSDPPPSEIRLIVTPESRSRVDAVTVDLRAAGLPSPVPIEVPSTFDPAAQWQQFETLKAALRTEAGVPVILDITHGFRSQPFFAAAVVAFIRAIDPDPPPLRVLYGAFEARDQQSNIAPIWDLTAFVDLLDWTREIMLFLKTGRVAGVAQRAEDLGRRLAKAWSQSERDGSRPKLDALARALAAFGRDLETVRTGALLLGDGSRPGSAHHLIEAIQSVRSEISEQLPPLADVLDRIEAMARPLTGCSQRLNHADGNAALVALAQLYLAMGRYSEAATTVREGLITQYAADEAACPGLKGFSPDRRAEAERLWQMRDRELARRVPDARNDIGHGGYRKRPLPADTMAKQIAGLVDAFQAAQPKSPAGCDAVFVNLSNHPSAEWGEAQRTAALALAPRIVDVPFPPVAPEATAEDVTALADGVLSAVPEGSTHALVQGEFTLAFALVRALQRRGIRCLAATSPRSVARTPEGDDVRRFGFVGFRSYLD